jgi:hypothetical protein
MSRARTKRNARVRTTKVGGAVASHSPDASLAPQPEWPEVLTLAEAAAYLRVPEAEVERIAGTQGLPDGESARNGDSPVWPSRTGSAGRA